jgi:micrococcal nuclease
MASVSCLTSSLRALWAIGVIVSALASPSLLLAETERESAPLISVTDGDTIAVQIGRHKEKVRLIGIDTPESRINDRARLQAERSKRDVSTILRMGKQSGKALKEMAAPGTSVQLEYDVRERDKYGRLLAYVYLPHGTMLNEEMLKKGYAQLLTMPPNVRYVKRFTAALEEAKKERRGLWADGGFSN